MVKISYLWCSVSIFFITLVSCTSGEYEESKTKKGWVKSSKIQTTKSGIKYQILLRKKNSSKISPGLHITYHQVIRNHKDSVLSTTYPYGPKKQIPFEGPYFLGYYEEMFQMLNEGDSVLFTVPCHLLISKKNPQLPPFLKKSETIRYIIKVLKLESRAAIKKELEKNKQAQLEIEDKIIADYLAKNAAFSPKKTSEGFYYSIDQKGSGKKPQGGDTVSVHYVGMLLDGTVFSSMQKGETFEFPLGQKPPAVIPGWEKAITLMNQGSKGTFIFPSHLAYGTKGSQDGVPPNAVVVFNVELVDVK